MHAALLLLAGMDLDVTTMDPGSARVDPDSARMDPGVTRRLLFPHTCTHTSWCLSG